MHGIYVQLFTDAFFAVAESPERIYDAVLHEIERFVVVMYNKTCAVSRVNQARKEVF